MYNGIVVETRRVRFNIMLHGVFVGEGTENLRSQCRYQHHDRSTNIASGMFVFCSNYTQKCCALTPDGYSLYGPEDHSRFTLSSSSDLLV